MFSNIFKTAKANIRGGKKYPKIRGTITFKETTEGVLLTAKIYKLPTSNTRCKRKFLWISYS